MGVFSEFKRLRAERLQRQADRESEEADDLFHDALYIVCEVAREAASCPWCFNQASCMSCDSARTAGMAIIEAHCSICEKDFRFEVHRLTAAATAAWKLLQDLELEELANMVASTDQIVVCDSEDDIPTA